MATGALGKKAAKARRGASRTGPTEVVPKVCGGDVELANFVHAADPAAAAGSAGAAARALLSAIDGVRSHQAYAGGGGVGATGYSQWTSGGWSYGYGTGAAGDRSDQTAAGDAWEAQDWGRKFLATNGGCAYIDLDHLELCVPEVTGARDFVAAWHAMLRTAGQALRTVNERRPPGRQIQALVNNSDGLGQSYGSHFNVLVTRDCFEAMCHRKLQQMLFFASYLTSSIVFSGAGKVGSENGRPDTAFQLSQRGDFFETLMGPQTTYRRPICNTRDEALCTTDSVTGTRSVRRKGDFARVHIIFFDNTLCHVSSFLKAGVTQLVLCMIEQGCIDTRLILDSPLAAVLAWSHDPTLTATAPTVDGDQLTALDLQEALFASASHFVAAGRADGLVPEAEQILSWWSEILTLLREGDLAALAGCLDWALKRVILERAIEQHHLSWDSPQVKHLDHLYSSLDPADGLYWAYERSGLTRQIVDDAHIERFRNDPPTDTRAWLRAQLLRRIDPADIVQIDWDRIRLRQQVGSAYGWPTYGYRHVSLPNPLARTREECSGLFETPAELDDVLDQLGAPRTGSNGQAATAPRRPIAALPAATAADCANVIAERPGAGHPSSAHGAADQTTTQHRG